MKMFAPMLLVTLASSAFAQQHQIWTSHGNSADVPLSWNLDAAYWDTLISRNSESVIRLGRSDVTLQGPLVYGLRPRRMDDDASALQRFADLPVIRLFVPQPMPTPPEGTGRYFAWRGSTSLPWASVSTRGGAAAGAYDATRREAQGLIGISW